MWLYRKALGISYLGRVTNVEVLPQFIKEVDLINEIKTCKFKWLGHVITRGERYETLGVTM